MRRFFKYIAPIKGYFLLGPLFTLAGAMLDVQLPSLVADMINRGLAGAGMDFIWRRALSMAAISLGILLVSALGARFATRASVLFAGSIRDDAFKKIQSFSFTDIDGFSTGSLVTRLTNDSAQIQQFSMQIMRMGIRSPAQLVGALIMAFRINVRLALVILVVAPVLGLVVALIIRAATPRFRVMQGKIDRMNVLLQEAMTNVRLIKSFVRGGYENKKFDAANVDMQQASLGANRVMLLQRPAMTLAMNLTTIAVIWFSGRMIIGGDMPVGDLAAFITYITQILTSLNMLSNILVTSSRAIVSANRIGEVLDTHVALNDENAGQKERQVEQGAIAFRHVSFRYFKKSPNPVLEDISFSLPGGKMVGIVGSTGSGKSTLVQMIPRLMDPDEGEALVDGVNVKEYSLKHLRNGVSMVLQNNLLFSGSIGENLRWGNENATEEDLDWAAECAQANLFIDALPERYETELGQGGVNLSGGQKQRLCIARALLKRPKILILDDSTSAVDTATEAHIRSRLAAALPDSTKIIIAQRISSVQDADVILVMEEGRLVGEGSHEQLLKGNKVYREIYDSQHSGKGGREL